MTNLLSLIQISLVSLLIFSNTFAIPTDINTICPKTANPPYCTTMLKAATSKDLKGLATYTINLLGTNSAKCQTLAKSLSQAAANPQLREQYAECAVNFEEAIQDVATIKKYLASGDYKGVNVITSGLMTEIGDCRDAFTHPPTDTSGLLKDEKTLEDISSIVLVISNLLSSTTK